MAQPVISVHGRRSNHEDDTTHWILPLAEVERTAIISALQMLNGRTDLAARALGIPEAVLLAKLRQYDL